MGVPNIPERIRKMPYHAKMLELRPDYMSMEPVDRKRLWAHYAVNVLGMISWRTTIAKYGAITCKDCPHPPAPTPVHRPKTPKGP